MSGSSGGAFYRGVTVMEFISAVRPVMAAVEPVANAQAGTSAGSAPASQSGSRASAAAASEIARPVAQASGTNSSRPPLTDQSLLSEAARDKVAAAQRAYMMTLRAVGVNPLANRVP
ncbi:hypothetical protein SAMN05519105_1642 [Rhodobacter sp. 24-YEA-8]|nr:hypothetical protein SAMN05519105_1642 [Rhodobacter sp. 24-YEA-8]